MIRTHSLTFYVVRCDHCGNQNRTVADGFSSEDAALASASAHGWQVWDEDGHHVCPRCVVEPCS